MKNLKQSLLLLVAVMTLSAAVFYSCGKDQFTGEESNTAQVAKEESDSDDDADKEPEYDIVPADDAMMMGNDWCEFTITLVRGGGGANLIQAGDVVCFHCPQGNVCPGVWNANKICRVIAANGQQAVYTLTFGSQGGSCNNCPNGKWVANGPF